jgi:zinc/manganese transport system substrate-binding protein
MRRVDTLPIRISIVVALLLASLGSISVRTAAQEPERLKVVATFSILGDVVHNVGGDAIDLTVIVGPDGDAHTFEPKPEQITALADADLIFENGLGLEPWLDDAYESSGSVARRVVVTDGLSLIDAGEEAHDAEEADHEENEHGEYDPHVWQDVQSVIGEVETIQGALAETDPANAETYRSHADGYTTQLQDLDSAIKRMAGTVPEDKRVIFTSHDSLGYLARAYGFTITGSALGSLSTEAADPSAGEIAELIEAIKASGVPAIFAENVESSDLMKQIAADAGVTLAPPLYSDALSKSDGPAATYIDMMTWNANTIVTALGGVRR